MPSVDRSQSDARQRVNRRQFLTRVGWGGVGAAALIAGSRRAARAAETYPDWLPPSTKQAKRGGTLTRASAWDPPVLDPRLTQSVGLYQFVALTSSRALRYAYSDEATGPIELSTKAAPAAPSPPHAH